MVIAPTLMRPGIGLRTAGTPRGRPAGGPCLIVLVDARGLVVGHPAFQRRLLLPQGSEDDSLLQRLMLLSHRTGPPERVCEQAGQHGLGRKVTDDAARVDRLPTEGGERRAEPQMHPAHRHHVRPVRMASPAHLASPASESRSASGISLPFRLANRRVSSAP